MLNRARQIVLVFMVVVLAGSIWAQQEVQLTHELQEAGHHRIFQSEMRFKESTQRVQAPHDCHSCLVSHSQTSVGLPEGRRLDPALLTEAGTLYDRFVRIDTSLLNSTRERSPPRNDTLV